MTFHPPKIAEVVVGLPVDGPFDYSLNEELQNKISIGQRVSVLFNRRKVVGYVVGLKQESTFQRLNPVFSILDESPVLSVKALKLVKAFSEHYGCSLGEAIEAYLPSGLRKNISFATGTCLENDDNFTVDESTPFLVHDLSRNKRWPFIIKQLEASLAKKQGIIFLVPEKSLIPMVKDRLMKECSAEFTVFDKPLLTKAEVNLWLTVRQGKAAVVIGTRSAVFAPVQNLGLIVVYDEENESYKQEQSPCYHVHDVVMMRSKIENSKTLFVSSAPLAETWRRSQKQNWEKVFFTSEGWGDIQIVDMTNYNPSKTSIVSFPLQNSIAKVLANRGKVFLLMNRKGFTTLTQCNQCGHQLSCPRCNVHLAYMYSKKVLACRHCNFTMPLPKLCPQCQQAYLRSMGTGTEKLESELSRMYPTAIVERYEKENEKFPHRADIVITTQAIFKEKENIKADLMAILNFDAVLNRFDFRSAQRAYSFLVSARQLAQEKLLVQTRMMENHCLQSLLKMDVEMFYQQELQHRKDLRLPPYEHIIAIGLRGRNEDDVLKRSDLLFNELNKRKIDDVEVFEPQPDAVPKLRDKYRYSIVVKGKSVPKALALIKESIKDLRRKKDVVVTINVDP
ncbi:MAG: primosomal protein N' [Candidatus Omnitrophica bacterium]|nr:primosomal protein N' [Candidatus Omnitrophota bacterium]